MEARLKEIETQLKQKGHHFEMLSRGVRGSEQRISALIADLQNQIKEKIEGGTNPDACITLEKGYAVNLDELEKEMEEKYSILTVKEREFQDLQKRISAEVESVMAKNKERDLLVAAKEVEMKNFKQTVEARIEELERLVKRQTEGKKRGNRLVSFLVDIGRKN
ncbi:MAG: hypothetical protein ACE5JU_07720 [Candidatus Binatia bacterium]